MTRFYLIALFLVSMPLCALATEAPPGQTQIGPSQVLRGTFVEERQAKNAEGPLEISGHFVVAPAYGLLWNIEKPFPTASIITPAGLVQDLGGVAIKLPAKNLQHLYKMVGDAISGNWDSLDADFTITRGGSAGHWQMLLVPRPNNSSNLTYSAITVSGGAFVENIVMTKADATYETLSFANEALSPAPPTPTEMMSFKKGAK
jgi:hypothetical protein